MIALILSLIIADHPIRGVVDSVDVTPGFPYVTVSLNDKRIPARHLMTFEDKEIYCDGKKADVGQFFAWMLKEKDVQVVLYPDLQRYGLVTKAEFTRKVRPLPKRAKLTVAPPPRPAVEYGFEYEVPPQQLRSN